MVKGKFFSEVQHFKVEKNMWLIYNIFCFKKKGINHMSETNNTIKSKKNQYHHLTKDDRAKIQSLIEQLMKTEKEYSIILILLNILELINQPLQEN